MADDDQLWSLQKLKNYLLRRNVSTNGRKTDLIESWFHPNVDRHTAQSLLLQNGVDGTYMLRDSSKLGDYALSVRCDQVVKHYPLTWTGDMFKFGHGEFSGVDDMLHHFTNKPLIGSESGQMTLLNYPYPRNIEEPNVYDTIRVHAEFSTAANHVKGPEFSINSKEGYLYYKTWWLFQDVEDTMVCPTEE